MPSTGDAALAQLGSGGVSVSLSELNPHFVCVLCFGYFVDATTITECMHTFCKSCIVNFLRTKRHCPRCDTLLTKTRPYNSLRPDRVMQALVFKTVPGLFQAEMRRRIEFYQGHPHADYEQDVEDIQHYVFSPDDSVSLSIRYYNFRDDTTDSTAEVGSVVRYFRCPATVPVAVLKTLVKTKYGVPDPLRVELLYGDDRLLDSWTLMEVAYIYNWKRESPMELSFQVVATRKVKKRRQQPASDLAEEEPKEDTTESSSQPQQPVEECLEPPDKVARLETPCEDSSTVILPDQPPLDTHPPTPPETPEGGRDREGEQFQSEEQPVTELEVQPEDDVLGGGVEEVTPVAEDNVEEEQQEVADGLEGEPHEVQEEVQEEVPEEAPELHAEDDVPRELEEDEHLDKEAEDVKEGEDDQQMEAAEDFDESKESNDLIVDHDSETPLEVDTSHETEPEVDGEQDGEPDRDQDGEPGENTDVAPEGENSGDAGGVEGETETRKNCADDEQEDSAIDVTETSASEPLDSDDKETDLNVSTESTEMEHEETTERTSSSKLVQTDEGPINLSQGYKGDKKIFRKDCYVFTDNEEDEDDGGELEEERDEVGALDLSRHARSVREARTQRESLDSPPSGSSHDKAENRSARGQGTQTILSITQSKKSKKLKQQQSATTGSSTPTAQTAPTVAPITRPPMPLDWAHSSLVPTPVTPQAVAFSDLMTLSQAAVQLQLAMAHAQAQAQAQAHQAQAEAQARAQAEAQARAQAQVLKSLKVSESLSFVNGSGDTLTISPISTQAEAKANKTANSKTANKSHHGSKAVNGNSYNKHFNTKSHNSHKSGSNAINTKSNSNNHGSSLRTTTPKTTLATSLKIPSVSVSSKTNGTTSPSNTKPDKDHTERTGDPVFKITNQKLADFLRRQHLQQKQNNNFKSSTTTTVTTTTSGICTVSSSGNSSPPTATKTPHIINSGFKVSTSSNGATSLTSSVSSARTSCSTTQSIRATNTSVRQIPNPSLLRQQSESRITSGLTGLGLSSRKPSESSKIESLTRSLHEKLAASSLAATINSTAR